MIKQRTLIIANWKTGMNVSESSRLSENMHKLIKGHKDIEVVLAPSFISLQPLSHEIDRRRFRLAAQNAYHKESGGFTGEVSFSMVHDLAHYVIIGHSERRIYFGETLELIRDKVSACIKNDLSPVLCVGETSIEKTEGQTKVVLHDQVVTALSNLTSDEVEKVVIAYEPVWAISNFGGETANPSAIAKIMKYIRKQVAELYGEKTANRIRILYGGSVDEHKATGFLKINDCQGVLVGSASRNAHKFAGIVESAYKVNRAKYNV